jgi:ATP-dependent exoDNAse (exonuclease V) beta subunit
MSYNKPFTVYKSSAGSGKTYTLVKEYLKLALATGQKEYYRYILAITFTNKAAEEMKARVFVCLKDISENLTSDHKNFSLQKSLTDELQIPLHELQHRAEQVLTHMLHHYSDIGISTIDKFTHKVLRTFAHDLHLPMNFEIEMDADSLLSEAVELLLAKVGEEKEVTNLLLNFAESKTENDKSWNIEKDIFHFSKNLLKEESESFLDSLRAIDINQYFECIKLLRKKKLDFENSLIKIGKEAAGLIKEKNIKNDSFFQGKNGIGTYFNYLSSFKSDKLSPNSYVYKTINENNWFSKKASEDQQKSIEEIKDELTSYYLDAQDILQSSYPEYLAVNDILVNIHSMALLKELEVILSEIKSEQNILPIAEFNKRISEIVRNESAPFIYERIGEKYHHFLIDEFQDTSIMQWQNILPLIHNSLSGANFNMIVGDGKQSIYRWRGGEVEQFSNLPKIFSKEPLNDILIERQQALVHAYNEKILNKNWRSKKEIIQFNNQFFRFLSDAYLNDLKNVYDKLEQEHNEQNTGGWVTCNLIKLNKNEINDSEEDELSESEKEKALKIMLNYIHTHLKRGYKQKDICVLCRKNIEGQEVADFLIENNLNVISPDSLLLAHNSNVQFIIHLLQYSSVPDNKVAQVKILEYLVDKTLLQHSFPEELYLQITKNEIKLEKLLSQYGISFSRNIIVQQPLFDAVESIIRLFKLNSSPDPYIQFFLNAVFEFSNRRNNSITDFLEWFEKNSSKLSIIVPEGSDAIQIMTIHKSKGLEFPVVIMPFANETINVKNELWVSIPDSYNLPIPVGLINASGSNVENPFYDVRLHEKSKINLDILNLLYVAFTRAVDALHIIITESKKNTNTYFWFTNYFSNYIEAFSPEAELIEIAPLPLNLKPHHSKETQTTIFNGIISSPWFEKIKLSLTAPEAWNIDNPDQASEYGKQLHDIIAAINSQSDLEEVLNKVLFEGVVSTDEAKRIQKDVLQIVNHPLLKIYFTGEYSSINEIEIIDKNGSTYRPDKIFIKDNKAVILDFKTGRKLPSHLSQIENYARLLDNLGYSVTEKYLCYTQNGEIIHV